MKGWGKTVIVFLLIGTVLAGCGYSLGNLFVRNHWTTVYKAELDRFFGKGNWECVDQRTELSSVYKTKGKSGKKVALRYHIWDLQFQNAFGEEELWSVTNLTLKLNQRQNVVFSPKRYSNKQALTLELMEIAEGLACEKVYKEILQSILTETESGCMQVRMMHTGGNPRPEFYSRLLKEEWFTVDGISAEKFLAYEECDFYIDILAFEWRLEKLTEEERQHICDSLGSIEQKLLDQYGENASFHIYLNEENRIEYVDGRKQ